MTGAFQKITLNGAHGMRHSTAATPQGKQKTAVLDYEIVWQKRS